jgi:hypothetical protein
MKTKKILIVVLALLLSMGLASCDFSKSSDSNDDRAEDADDKDDDDEDDDEDEDEDEDDKDEDDKDETTEATTEEATEATTEEATEATTEEVEDSTSVEESTETESEELSNVEGLSEIYADLDNRSFSVNGKVYTVGVSTLQDMIDDGVVFDEGDIANASNNLNPNYQSQGFNINLDDYYFVKLYTSNFTEENQTAASCPITQVYLPVNLDKNNEILVFAFPLTITEEELRENSGEPTEYSEYISDDGNYIKHTLEYTRESDVYFGDSGYTFEFTNGVLDYFYISFK